MALCDRFGKLKHTLKQWVNNLKSGTQVAIVTFGTRHECVTGSKKFDKGCYIQDRGQMLTAIDGMSFMGLTWMASALKDVQVLMKDEHDWSQSQPGTVILVTDGLADGLHPIDAQDIWQPFKSANIRVITLNLYNEVETRLQKVITETGGKAFISTDCPGLRNSREPFNYASETFIPGNIGDRYMQRQTITKETIPGVHMLHCFQTNDNEPCFKHTFAIDKSLRAAVNVNMLLSLNGKTVREFIKDVDVRIHVDDIKYQNKTLKIDGFKLQFETDEEANYYRIDDLPEEFTETLLDVYVTLNEDVASMLRLASLTFETQAKSAFDDSGSVDYHISCDHPVYMKKDKEFKITSTVKRGSTRIKHANVVARITVADDPEGNKRAVIYLCDDGGVSGSGDEHENDGTYTGRVNLAQLGLSESAGIDIICNMVESPGAEWNDNDFFGKRSVPTQNGTFTPYCCGTKDQNWNIPKTKDVTNFLRSSIASAAFIDPSLLEEGVDIGPPARITNLKAEMIGKPKEGLVRLSWTATGDDWASGTAQSYNLVYSDKRKGLMKSNRVTKDSKMLIGGSMEPVIAGEKMEVIIKLENHHVPGTYMFALNATDDAGKVSRPSNIARINFHDGSPLVLDADPHLVHGHAKNDLPFEEKIRRITKDERIVTRFMTLIEKNKKIVRDAENNVIEKRLKEKMGHRGTSVGRIMDKIRNDDVLRA